MLRCAAFATPAAMLAASASIGHVCCQLCGMPSRAAAVSTYRLCPAHRCAGACAAWRWRTCSAASTESRWLSWAASRSSHRWRSTGVISWASQQGIPVHHAHRCGSSERRMALTGSSINLQPSLLGAVSTHPCSLPHCYAPQHPAARRVCVWHRLHPRHLEAAGQPAVAGKCYDNVHMPATLPADATGSFGAMHAKSCATYLGFTCRSCGAMRCWRRCPTGCRARCRTCSRWTCRPAPASTCAASPPGRS